MRTSPQLTSPMKQLLDKLTSRGSASLDDTELLTLLLGEGGEQAARRLAERLLEYYDGALARLGRDPLTRLRMVEGMGQRRAARIAAAAELGRRILQAQAAETTTLVTSDDVIRLFRPELERLTRAMRNAPEVTYLEQGLHDTPDSSTTRSAGQSTFRRRTASSNGSASVRAACRERWSTTASSSNGRSNCWRRS